MRLFSLHYSHFLANICNFFILKNELFKNALDSSYDAFSHVPRFGQHWILKSCGGARPGFILVQITLGRYIHLFNLTNTLLTCSVTYMSLDLNMKSVL